MFYGFAVKFYCCVKCRPIQQGHVTLATTPPTEQQIRFWCLLRVKSNQVKFIYGAHFKTTELTNVLYAMYSKHNK